MGNVRIRTKLLQIKLLTTNFKLFRKKHKRIEQKIKNINKTDPEIGKNKDTKDTKVFVTDRPIKTLSVN